MDIVTYKLIVCGSLVSDDAPLGDVYGRFWEPLPVYANSGPYCWDDPANPLSNDWRMWEANCYQSYPHYGATKFRIIWADRWGKIFYDHQESIGQLFNGSNNIIWIPNASGTALIPVYAPGFQPFDIYVPIKALKDANGNKISAGNYVITVWIENCRYDFNEKYNAILLANKTLEVSGLDLEKENEIIVYPVPSDNVLNIVAETLIHSIEIIDVMGNIVYSVELENKTEHTLTSVQDYSGSMLLRIRTEEGVSLKRVLFIR